MSDTMKIFPAALLIVMSCNLTLAQEAAKEKPFQVCQGTYALCTFSQCGPAQAQGPGQDSTTTCTCRVRPGPSVGTECEQPATAPDGQTIIRSRYYPISGYARCSNNKPWAMCLDVKCTVDKDKAHAKCGCSVQEEKGDYLVQTGCPTGIISSATVLDLDKITDFLETQDQIPVSNFLVLNPKQK
jgi:hypothetical protein